MTTSNRPPFATKTPSAAAVQGTPPVSSAAEDPVVIVTAGDDGFALPMAVMLSSALKHLPQSQTVEVYVLDAGLTENSRRRLDRVVQLNHPRAALFVVRPDRSEIADLNLDMDPRFNASIFYRLLIPDILPDRYSRVLYLDSDVVVDRDLLPMWERSFEGTAALAVPERIVSCPEAGIAEWEALGLDPKSPYFNSGVMLLNLDVWREKNLHRKVIDYLRDPSNRFCYASDQEALNAVLAGQWKALDLRWNATHLLYSEKDRPRLEAMLETDLGPVARDPFIIHFTTEWKPWRAHCNHDFEHRFHYYLRRSGWFGRMEYLVWQLKLWVQKGMYILKQKSRPLRHAIGIRRQQSAGSVT